MPDIDFEELPFSDLKRIETDFGFHDPKIHLRNPLTESRAIQTGKRATLAIKMNALSRPRRIFQRLLERKKKEKPEVFNLEKKMERVKPDQMTLNLNMAEKEDVFSSLGTQSMVCRINPIDKFRKCLILILKSFLLQI